MDCDRLLEVLRKRQSHYDYKPDDDPDELIDKIFEAARWHL